MNRRSNRLTIKQVASAAGVSTRTVSRVINSRPDVSVETRRRVQAVIDEAGTTQRAGVQPDPPTQLHVGGGHRRLEIPSARRAC